MWLIGGLIGLSIGLLNGHGFPTFLMKVGGVIAGLLLKASIKSLLDEVRSSNLMMHQQGAALLHELKNKILLLEEKLRKLELDLHQYKNSSARALDAVQSTPPTASAESLSTPASMATVNEASFMTLASSDSLSVSPIETTATNDIALNVNLVALPKVDVAPVASPISHTLTSPAEQPLLNTVSKPAIASTSTSTKTTTRRLPPPPPKPWRERLPQPIADIFFGGNTLVKIGVLILFLGLTFLLRYAAEHTTVPIELRYVGVALSGIVLLALGWMLRHKRRDYALILQGMAIGVFYLTILSAIKMHGLISPELGFSFLFIVSLLSAALAILQNAPVLAIVAALEGFAAPVLTSTGANRPIGLFTYLAVLDVGIFLVAWFNAWRVLNLIAFVGTFTLSLGWAQKFYTNSDYDVVQPFLIFFFVLFALIGILFARRTLLEEKNVASARHPKENPLSNLKRVGRVDSALVFGNPVTAFSLQYLLVEHTRYGAAFSALAIGLFYVVLARFVFSKEKHGLALLAEAYVVVAAIFATLAIPLGLEGTWTSAAWAIEGAGMYWLGVRQGRPYARAFAFIVMIGATVKLLNSMAIDPTPTLPLLQGSLLGPVLLGLSALTMWYLHRRAEPSSVNSWEKTPSTLLPWLACAAFTCLPWMLLSPTFAAAATAVLGLLVADIGMRFSLPSLRPIAASMQAVALLSFLQTLHLDRTEQSQALLSDGWRGMVAALMIAISIVFNAGRHMLKTKREREHQGLPPSWTFFNGVAVVSASILLHIAMLFAIDLQQAAWIWPLSSGVLLWVALRMSHKALASFALVLQLVSAALCIIIPSSEHGKAFAHFGFITPLAIAIAAWWSADLMRGEAARLRDAISRFHSEAASSTSNFKPWLNPWCTGTLPLWLPILWGLAWWLAAWFPEAMRVLDTYQNTKLLSAIGVIISIATAALMYVLGVARKWRQMGAASAISLPLFAYCAVLGLVSAQTNYLPSAHWGWWAWPLALCWHLYALRGQRQWLDKSPHFNAMLHMAGFWLFLILAAREVQGRFVDMANAWSSWPLLGWIIVPALVLWLIGTKLLASRWPLNTYRSTYLETACAPVGLYLFLWCWVTNIYSAGDASPLPYIPLLNPLELGQCLVLTGLLHWWRVLPNTSPMRCSRQNMQVIGASTGLALLTGAVLRSVHHFGGIAWDADALFDSRLAQASVSITWALCGVATMLLGNRRGSRGVWIAGAALLGIVVAKLFLLELADRGGLYRIVSFIGVGIAILVVGYFAPVPVKPSAAASAAGTSTPPSAS